MELAAVNRTGNAFRPGTRANHQSHLLLYTAFALHYGLPPFPATPRTLVLFGEFLLRGYKAPKSITNAFSSLRAFHLDGNFDAAAFGSRRVSLFCRALPLTIRHVPARAPPLPLTTLELLCATAQTQGREGLVFAGLLAVTFFAMTRLSSLAPPAQGPYDFSRYPSFADVIVQGHSVRLRIKWGKCAQAPDQGFTVPLLPLRASPACPVTLLSALAASARGDPALTRLFSLPHNRNRGSTRYITAGSARSRLAYLLSRLHLSQHGYTFHSLRRGACSRAYEGGASLPDLQFLGGWRGNSVQLYAPSDAARTRAALCLVSGPSLNN